MSEIDRVFARMGGSQSTQGEQRESRNVPRKGAAGTRVVEVVRLPSRGAAPKQDPSRRPTAGVRSQAWEDGFPTRAAPPGAAPEPVVAKLPEPVAHVMPAWEPTAAEPATDPAPTAVPTVKPARQAAKQARRDVADGGRRVADPFDSNDDGANCLRCGYLIQPARERRGLMTCAACG